MFLYPKDHNRSVHMLLLVHEFFITFNYFCSVSVVWLIFSHKYSHIAFLAGINSSTHTEAWFQQAVLRLSLGNFLLFFFFTNSNNYWFEGPKWQTWFIASWWMDCKDNDLDFACDLYVLPSQCCHQSMVVLKQHVCQARIAKSSLNPTM